MNKVLLLIAAVLISGISHAQIQKGRVVYERVSKMQGMVRMRGGENPDVTRALNNSLTERFELLFGNNQSLWQKADDAIPEEEPQGNVAIRMVVAGSDDVSHVDIATGKITGQVEVGGKNFIIEDSVAQISWKIGEETKTILGHICRKATAEVIGTRPRMQLVNGEMKREEVTDTTVSVAWFAADIPVFAGPVYPKQLPGLILELNINNGRTVYTAVELTEKIDVAKIKVPAKGKKITKEQLRTERENMMKQMQQNMRGGNFEIRAGA